MLVMSHKSKQGKAAWAARSGRYPEELASQIQAGAAGQMDRWAARGRIPRRARLYARLRGVRLSLPGEGGQR
jgi:hypothetical protein